MSFSREIMALLCLTVVFVNTVLITLDLGGWLRKLLRFRSRLSSPRSGGERLFQGCLQGPGGARAALELVLVGHGRGEGKIFFHGRSASPCFPDELHLASSDQQTAVSLLLRTDPHSWIWPSEEALAKDLACPSVEAFDEFAPRTERGKGAERTIRMEFDAGQPVFVYGARASTPESIEPAPLVLDPSGTPRLILAAFDPRTWALKQITLIGLVLPAIWLTFAALTWICFQGPAFGFWSQVGALGLLGFFLLVQPLGVAVRERTVMPHERPRAPVWKRPRGAAFMAAVASPPHSTHSLPSNSP